MQDSDETILKIKNNANNNQIDKVLFFIHSIKGTAGNVGANCLYQYMKKTESLLKNNIQPQNWMNDLENIYQETKKEIVVALEEIKEKVPTKLRGQ